MKMRISSTGSINKQLVECTDDEMAEYIAVGAQFQRSASFKSAAEVSNAIKNYREFKTEVFWTFRSKARLIIKEGGNFFLSGYHKDGKDTLLACHELSMYQSIAIAKKLYTLIEAPSGTELVFDIKSNG
jgi:hypothetical protein